MKNELSVEESAKLIELGVDQTLASGIQYADTGEIRGGIELPPVPKPVFRLTDILAILPKEIDGHYLNMSACAKEWHAYYEKIEILGRRIILRTNSAPELIDALNKLLIWKITKR